MNTSPQEGFLILHPGTSRVGSPIGVNIKEISHMSCDYIGGGFIIITHLRSGMIFEGCCIKDYQAQNADDALNQMIELCEMIMGHNLLTLHPEVVL